MSDATGDDRPTCGKGLAAHAILPATMAELLRSSAARDRQMLAR
jgi:hypothetical protein